jgi:cytochrome c-type biogenesis protein CcmH
VNTFIAASLVLLLFACAFVIVPLLRSPTRRQQTRLQRAFRQGLLTPEEFAAKLAEEFAAKLASSQSDARDRGERAPRLAGLAVLLLMPAAGVWLYQQVGTPTALQWPTGPRAAASGERPAADIPALEARAASTPEDRVAWMRLASAYTAAGRFGASAEALQRALDLTDEDAPERADILASIAENQLFGSTGRVPESAERNLAAALDLDPQNPRALWLSGAVAYQQADYRTAVRRWQTLLPLVDDDDVAGAVREQLDLALAALHTEVGATLPGEAPAANAPEASASVRVEVDFAPALSQRLAAHEGSPPVLFVFARRPGVPGPPLAIQRLPDPSAPLSLTLDDSMAMVPGNGLGSVGDGAAVEIVARLSWSGNAAAQPGDWESAGTVRLDGSEATPGVALMLDRQIEG